MSEVFRRSESICGDDDEGYRMSVVVQCGTWKRKKLGSQDCLTERMPGNDKANCCPKGEAGTEA
jgi:hypothetical protein